MEKNQKKHVLSLRGFKSLLTCVSPSPSFTVQPQKAAISHACLQSSALHSFIQYVLRPQAWVFFFHFFVPYYRNECIHGCLVSSSIQLLFQQAAEISTSRMLNVHERRLKRTHNSTNVWSLQSTSFFTILSTVSEVILLYWYHTFQLLSFKLFKIF